MQSNVKVTANKEGKVITPNAKPGKDGKSYGFIRVESTETSLEGGFAKIRTRSALVSGLMSDLEKMNFKSGQVLPGKICIKESTEKFVGAQEKKAGAEGAVLTKNGAPIWRGSFYTEKADAQDILLQHDTVNAPVASGAAL